MLLRPFLNHTTSCASYLFGCGTHAKHNGWTIVAIHDSRESREPSEMTRSCRARKPGSKAASRRPLGKQRSRSRTSRAPER
jgi:hypothetical protein